MTGCVHTKTLFEAIPRRRDVLGLFLAVESHSFAGNVIDFCLNAGQPH